MESCRKNSVKVSSRGHKTNKQRKKEQQSEIKLIESEETLTSEDQSKILLVSLNAPAIELNKVKRLIEDNDSNEYKGCHSGHEERSIFLAKKNDKNPNFI